MRSRLLLVIAAGGIALLGIGVMTLGSGSQPKLVIDASVAPDFAQVAEEDWVLFVTAFPAQQECIGQVTLIADYDLDDLAKYDPSTRTMAVRVPAPEVLLDRALIHELAHHLEFVCPSQVDVRKPFLAALSRSGDEWFAGQEWSRIPSEIFAEGVVEYVLNERGRVHVDIGLIEQSAVDVIVEWATGG
ncbi:MAG: hypothetical protein GY926_02890 [bacterium]|nr:hypothetical protein [bacterium]